MDIKIVNEAPEHHLKAETLTREAFWDVYTPGTDNHYFVHIMRTHPDYLPHLSFVALLDGEVIGAIYSTKSFVERPDGTKHPTVTFGPLGVHPGHQRRGIGRLLIDAVKNAARSEGYGAMIIMGSPHNYVGKGFKSCHSFGIASAEGKYPTAMLACELHPGALDGITGKFYDSPVFADIDPEAVEAYDSAFAHKEKGYRPSQTEFEIMCRSVME